MPGDFDILSWFVGERVKKACSIIVLRATAIIAASAFTLFLLHFNFLLCGLGGTSLSSWAFIVGIAIAIAAVTAIAVAAAVAAAAITVAVVTTATAAATIAAAATATGRLLAVLFLFFFSLFFSPFLALALS